jgi:hypothetical protein
MGDNDKHASLRATILEESMKNSMEPGALLKWGYFGNINTLAIGDNSYSPPTIRKAKDDSDVNTTINITSRPNKGGRHPGDYFKFEQSHGVDDPYVDPGAHYKPGKVEMLDPDAKFKPVRTVPKPVNKLGYEYIPHCDTAKDPKMVKEQYKETGPSNILCNPVKKGGPGVLTTGVLFGYRGTDDPGKFPEHLPDEYDGLKVERKNELKEHKDKVTKCHEVPFRQMAYGNNNFWIDSDVYNYRENAGVPTHVPRDKAAFDKHIKQYPHEAPMRPSNPSKKGIVYGLMGGKGAHEYIEDPPAPVVRKPKPADGEEPPPPFKGSNPRNLRHATSSIMTLSRNMRADRPSSFARPSF